MKIISFLINNPVTNPILQTIRYCTGVPVIACVKHYWSNEMINYDILEMILARFFLLVLFSSVFLFLINFLIKFVKFSRYTESVVFAKSVILNGLLLQILNLSFIMINLDRIYNLTVLGTLDGIQIRILFLVLGGIYATVFSSFALSIFTFMKRIFLTKNE